MFERIAIADHGGPALRALQTLGTLREIMPGLRTVLLHRHDRPLGRIRHEVDEVVSLPTQGETATDGLMGWISCHSPAVDALWVGWGAPDEHLAIAATCESVGVTFVGPRASTLTTIADRAALTRVLADGGVRLDDGTLAGAPDTRRLEVHVMADGRGTAWSLGVVDRSLRRNGRTLLASSAEGILEPARSGAVKESALRVVQALDLRGAASVELLLTPANHTPAVLGVRPHLTSTHALTELTTGLDLVELQLAIAAGGALDDSPPGPQGHAVGSTLRLDEIPDPAIGTARVERLRIPSSPGVRNDAAVHEGDEIPARTGAELTTISAVGRDRGVALARLAQAVSGTTVTLTAGSSDRAPLLGVLRHPEVRRGAVGQGWLAQGDLAGGGGGTEQTVAAAIVGAAITEHATATEVDLSRFLTSAGRGHPQVEAPQRHTFDLDVRGRRFRVRVACVGSDRYELDVDGQQVTARLEHRSPEEATLHVAGRRSRIVTIRQGADLIVDVDGASVRVTSMDAGVIRASHPSVVARISVQAGDEVEHGDALAVLESMKLETVVTAPFAGRIDEVLVTENVQLDTGAPILRMEPTVTASGNGSVSGTTMPLLEAPSREAPDPRTQRLESLDALRRRLLGFDVPEDRIIAELDAGDASADPTILRAELEVLRVFADTMLLTRNRRQAWEAADGPNRSDREHFRVFLRTLDLTADGLPEIFGEQLRAALAHHGVHSLERTRELEVALYRIHRVHQRAATHVPAILALLGRWLATPSPHNSEATAQVESTLERLIRATELPFPSLGDLARRVRYRVLDEPRMAAHRDAAHRRAREHLLGLARSPEPEDRQRRLDALLAEREPLLPLLQDPTLTGDASLPLLEALTWRNYRQHRLRELRATRTRDTDTVVADLILRRRAQRVVAARGHDLATLLEVTSDAFGVLDAATDAALDAYLDWPDAPRERGQIVADLLPRLHGSAIPQALRRVTVTTITDRPEDDGIPKIQLFTFHADAGRWQEQRYLRGIHPTVADRLDLWRLEHFDLTRLRSSAHTYLFRCAAREHEDDVRLFAMGEVRDLTPTLDTEGRITALPELERILAACLDDVRHALAELPPRQRPDWNRILLNVWPVIDIDMDDFDELIRALAPLTAGLGIEQVMVQARVLRPNGKLSRRCIRVSYTPGRGVTLQITVVPTRPLQPLDERARRVAKARRQGLTHPADVIPLLVRTRRRADPSSDEGTFVESDLDATGSLVAVDRALGHNTASIVVGVVTTPTDRYPDGLTRVALLSDPTIGLGSLAEGECRRIIAAINLAEDLGVPVEWFAVSSGARIAMDSGTENMDWIARVLRRIIEFTQAGGEINVIVTGINVGAQPYWNAEATMLMHTKGILVMTPDSAMVLTGKQALDYSGGVSAEDNLGIGGYDRVMGPNGQAQYWATDLASACELLYRHYDLTSVMPGETLPRRRATVDPHDRDVRSSPHQIEGSDFTTVGDIFSEQTNPGRKKPFDIRTLLRAVADQDVEPLERWADMANAGNAVVFDAQLGGRPVCLLGVESRPSQRRGIIPADGPGRWTAGTLFPQASKKLARAINTASGGRPLVVLGNLSGFDGSPESLRELQLEYGAEIGRAVVNFDGPIVFCVVSRYHGGAFVVFSRTLNDSMHVAAIEGSRASVIGGAPAAAVVFAREVDARTANDPRVRDLEERLANADEADLVRLHAELDELRGAVRSEMLGRVAAEFDAIHDVDRAVEVGSIDQIISGGQLRPYLIDAVERGLARQ